MIMRAEKPVMCCRQAGDPGDPMVCLQSKSEALRSREAGVGLGPRAGEDEELAESKFPMFSTVQYPRLAEGQLHQGGQPALLR